MSRDIPSSPPSSQCTRDTGTGTASPMTPRKSSRQVKPQDPSKGFTEYELRSWRAPQASPTKKSKEAKRNHKADLRQDPERRQEEQAADTAARSQARLDEETLQRKRAADKAARSQARHDEETRQREQTTNTAARSQARSDEETRQREQTSNTTARSQARQDEETRQREQTANTAAHQESRRRVSQQRPEPAPDSARHELLQQPNRPTPQQLQDFDKCPVRAVLLSYEGIDTDYHGLQSKLRDLDPSVTQLPDEHKPLLKKFEELAPTDNQLNDIIGKFKSKNSIEQSTPTCGFCGCRDYEDSINVKSVPLFSVLGRVMKLTDGSETPHASAASSRSATPEVPSSDDEEDENAGHGSDSESVVIPPSEEEIYLSRPLLQQQVMSVYKYIDQAAGGQETYFYVHPEFVTLNEADEPITDACASCFASLRKGHRPKMSVANVDYGLIDRIPGLPKLTMIEHLLLQPTRTYGFVFKLNGVNPNKLVNHVITFEHDAPKELSNVTILPSVLDVIPMIKVQFVGEKSKWEKVQNSIGAKTVFEVRATVVLKYLRILKEINPAYRDITIQDEQLVTDDIRKLTDMLRDNVEVIDDKQIMNLESNVGADITGNHEVDDELSEADLQQLLDFEISESFICPKDISDLTAKESASINIRSVDLAINGTASRSAPNVIVNRTSDAINEMSNNKVILYGTYVTLFPMREGLLKERDGLVDCRQIIHMMTQWHHQFSNNRLIFHLFDQKRRHTCSMVNARKTKNTPEAAEQFQKLLVNATFQEKLSIAKENPLGEEAKWIMRIVEPILLCQAVHVEYSPAERMSLASDILACCRENGTPSFFVTVSPDDSSNPVALRLSIKPTSNASFPVIDDGFAGSLRCKDEEYKYKKSSTADDEIEFTIPIKRRDCVNLITAHTESSVRSYGQIIDSFFEDILGIQLTGKSKKSVPVQSRPPGVFGKVLAAIGCSEVQQRGCLHAHVLVWTEAPNSIYLDCAHQPLLFKALSESLDRIVTANMTSDAHIKGIVNLLEKKENSRGPHFECPDDINSPEFQHLVDQNFNSTQIHLHRKTFCGKYTKNENSTCRAAKPSPPSFGTCAVQLVLDDVEVEGAEPKKVLRVVPQISPPVVKDFDIKDPLERPDARIIAITLNRPLNIVVDPDGIPMSEQTEYDPDQYTYQEIKVTPALKTLLLNLSEDQQKAVIAALVNRNTSVAETNKVLLVLVGSNSASYFLGAPEQSMAATFYLIKYVTKDSAAIGQTLSLVHKALEHVKKFPSTAVDPNSAVRLGMYFSQRLVNMLGSMDEYAATQAMACILGLPANFVTMKKQYLFNWAAVAAVNATVRQIGSIGKDSNLAWEDQEDALEQFADDQGIDSSPLDNAQHGPGTMHDNFVNESALTDLEQMQRIAATLTSFGGVPIYTVGDKRIPVAQHQNYQYRDEKLNFVSQYEFVKCFEVKLKPKPKSKPSTRGSRNESTETSTPADSGAATTATTHVTRREKNVRYELRKEHPLHETHEICIRSKQSMIVLAGGAPPKYPSSHRPWAKREERDAAKFALYYMTLFSEWEEMEGLDGVFLPKDGTTWIDFCQFINRLKQSNAYYDKAKLIRMKNMIFATDINTAKKNVLSLHRYSNAARAPEYSSDAVNRLANMFMTAPLEPSNHLFHPHGDDDDDASDTTSDTEYLNGLLDAAALFESTKLSTNDMGKYLTQEGQSDALIDSLNSIYGKAYQAHAAASALSGERNQVSTLAVEPDSILHVRKTTDLTPKQMTEQLRESGLGANYDPDALPPNQPVNGPATQPLPNAGNIFTRSRLNVEQLKIFDTFTAYLDKLETWRNQADSTTTQFRLPKPVPSKIFAHGGPGVGKSFMTNVLIHELKRRGEKFRAVSFTGIASSLLVEGQTIHGSFGLDPKNITAGYEKISIQARTSLEQRWDKISVLFVDEFSMVSAELFCAMDQRLQGIFNNNLPFGGLALLLIGDMHQIEATSGKPLYDAMIESIKESPIATTTKPTTALAARLFASFTKVELIQQMRAIDDDEQGKLVEKFRNFATSTPIDNDVIKFLKSRPLTMEDILADLSNSSVSKPTDWVRTTIVATSNHKVDKINYSQMRRFAKLFSLPILKWKKTITPPSKKLAKSTYAPPPAVQELIYDTHDSMWEYFVYAAPCVITENIRPDLKLSNGTSGTMYSLTLKALNEVGENERDGLEADYESVKNAVYGDDVILNVRPLSINIKISNHPIDLASWPRNLRLSDDSLVIPCIDQSDSDRVKLVQDYLGSKRTFQLTTKALRCSLAFARTYHKIQGSTMERIILDIHPTMYCPIRLAQLYVGITRIRSQADIRILPLPDDTGDTWVKLKGLQRKPNLQAWYESYDSTGKWNPSAN